MMNISRNCSNNNRSSVEIFVLANSSIDVITEIAGRNERKNFFASIGNFPLQKAIITFVSYKYMLVKLKLFL